MVKRQKSHKINRSGIKGYLILSCIAVMILLAACSRDFSSVDWNKVEFKEKVFVFAGWDDKGMILLDETGRRSKLEYIDVNLIPLQTPLLDDLEKDEKLIVDCADKEKIFDRKNGEMTYATRYGILRRANGKPFHCAEVKKIELVYLGVKEEGTAFRRYGNNITAYFAPQEKDRNECLRNSVVYNNGTVPSEGLNRYEACEILLFKGEGDPIELYFVDNVLRLINFDRETQRFTSFCTPDEMTPGMRLQLSVSDNLFRNGEWVLTILRAIPALED